MAVDVGAGRALNEVPMGLDWRRLAVDGEGVQPASIEEQVRQRRAMAARVQERQMDWLAVDAEEQRAANED